MKVIFFNAKYFTFKEKTIKIRTLNQNDNESCIPLNNKDNFLKQVIYKWLNEWMNEWMNEQMNERMEKWTLWTHVSTNEWENIWMNNKWKNEYEWMI